MAIGETITIADPPIPPINAPKIEVGSASSGVTAPDPLPAFSADAETLGIQARERSHWGHNFSPELRDRDAHQRYQRIVEDLYVNVVSLKPCIHKGRVTRDGLGFVVEIDRLLDELYRCEWGPGENLKSAVVVIQSQIKNAKLKDAHVRFLDEAILHLRACYFVTENTVQDIYSLVGAKGLDRFRGTLSGNGVKTRYRIVKAKKT
jgi:hypothetical protein